MKAVIGTEDDVVGFGLTGISQRVRLPMDASHEAITEAINQLAAETTTVFINEALLTRLQYHTPDRHDSLTFIMIPDTEKTPNIDEIERIAKKTLGVEL